MFQPQEAAEVGIFVHVVLALDSRIQYRDSCMCSSSVTTTQSFLYQSSAAKPLISFCLLFSANQIIELELTLIDMVHKVPDATWFN